MFLFFLKIIDLWFLMYCAWSVHKSAGKTLADCFATVRTSFGFHLRWLHTVLRAVSSNSPCELEPFSCDNLANDILANCQNCVQPPWENVWEVGIVIVHSQIVLEISTAKGVQKFLRHFKVYVVLLPLVNFSGLIRNRSFVSLLVNVPQNFWGHKDHVIKIF